MRGKVYRSLFSNNQPEGMTGKELEHYNILQGIIRSCEDPYNYSLPDAKEIRQWMHRLHMLTKEK